MQLFFFY